MVLKADKSGQFPLHPASEVGNHETVQALLNCFQRTDETLTAVFLKSDEIGHITLHPSAKSHYHETFQALLKRVQEQMKRSQLWF
jgi:hypothetical protein